MKEPAIGPQDLISAVDAARILDLSADMVRLLARSGRLPTAVESTRGVRLFRRVDVAKLAAERAGQPASDHLVQFYEDEAFLARVVAAFIRKSLKAGVPAIVIATEAHRRTFRDQLERDGCAVAQAVRSHELSFLDAEETLGRIVVAGKPNPRGFEQVIGAAMDGLQPAKRRQTVRVYGEMVDLLWASGQRSAALRLEGLWNGLIRRRSVLLLCSYSLANFRRREDGKLFEEICRAHPQVGPPDGFPADGRAEAVFRHVAVFQQRALAGAEEHRRNMTLEAESQEHKRRLVEAAREVRRATEAIRKSLAAGPAWAPAGGLRAEISRLARLADALERPGPRSRTRLAARA